MRGVLASGQSHALEEQRGHVERPGEPPQDVVGTDSALPIERLGKRLAEEEKLRALGHPIPIMGCDAQCPASAGLPGKSFRAKIRVYRRCFRAKTANKYGLFVRLADRTPRGRHPCRAR